MGLGILVRICKHRRDYACGPNHWFPLDHLKISGLKELLHSREQLPAEHREQRRSISEERQPDDQFRDTCTSFLTVSCPCREPRMLFPERASGFHDRP